MSCYDCLRRAYRDSGFFSNMTGMRSSYGLERHGGTSPHHLFMFLFSPLCFLYGEFSIPASHPRTVGRID